MTRRRSHGPVPHATARVVGALAFALLFVPPEAGCSASGRTRTRDRVGPTGDGTPTARDVIRRAPMIDPAVQQAIAAGAARVQLRVQGVTFDLVRIPAGEFLMGSPETEEGRKSNEGPQTRVRITAPFYLGRYEVTQAQYRAILGEIPSAEERDDAAVDGVSYLNAAQFCFELTRLTGITVTLPTEAQWEYACRAGSTTRYYTGDTENDLDRAGWYEANSGGEVQPPGKKQPNAWGLYDMHGNVWEYCADYHETYQVLEAVDPVGSQNPHWGALRGGGYLFYADECRSASRMMSNDMFGVAGIRIAINPDPEADAGDAAEDAKGAAESKPKP